MKVKDTIAHKKFGATARITSIAQDGTWAIRFIEDSNATMNVPPDQQEKWRKVK
jgi:hypothetical protein